jgi:hypothetical protein
VHSKLLFEKNSDFERKDHTHFKSNLKFKKKAFFLETLLVNILAKKYKYKQAKMPEIGGICSQ